MWCLWCAESVKLTYVLCFHTQWLWQASGWWRCAGLCAVWYMGLEVLHTVSTQYYVTLKPLLRCVTRAAASSGTQTQFATSTTLTGSICRGS
mmetsp:Transcript_12474/g.19246  ORF Transcript_12474/g.19246 Transcript_12474/m.19246 type:complete len:92 (+) Transcript_12474:629-904(+)